MHPSRAVFHHLARMLGTEEVELYTTYLAKGMDIRIGNQLLLTFLCDSNARFRF